MEPLGNDYLRLLSYQNAIDKPDEETADDAIQNQELRSQVVYLTIEGFRREELSRGKLLELNRKLGFGDRELLALAQGAR